MNRKKIALLLTSLVITSAAITGCSSETKDEANRNSMVNEQPLRRASEKVPTNDYNYESNAFPNVAYADDISGSEFENNIIPDGKNSQTGILNNENSSFNQEDLGILPNDSEIKNGINSDINSGISNSTVMEDENLYNFKDSDSSKEYTGFSGVVEDELNISPSTNDSKFGSNELDDTKSNISNEKNKNNSKGNQSKTSVSSETIKSDDEKSSAQVATELGGTMTTYKTEGSSEGAGVTAQGTAKVSFRLGNDVLDAQVAGGTIGKLLKDAANETINETNGVVGSTGVPVITARTALVTGLTELFRPSMEDAADFDPVLPINNGNVEPTPLPATRAAGEYKPLQFSFSDENGLVTSLDFGSYMFDANDLIDENSFVVNPGTKQNYSNVDLEPSTIAIKMTIKINSPTVTTPGLKTNTSYSFNGYNKNPEYVTGEEVAGNLVVKYLDSFTIGNFKTAKQQSTLDATKADGTTKLIYNNVTGTAELLTTPLEFSIIDDSKFLDIATLITEYDTEVADESASTPSTSVVPSDILEITGTSIKFKKIIFGDIDSTVSKIEVQDSRGDKYPASLVAVDPKDKSKGFNLQISGLERNNSYTFINMHITAQPGNNVETKVLSLTDNTGLENSKTIRTTAFSGPQLELAATVTTGNETVILPNGISIPVVKNDSTALRYVVKVANSEGLVGDVSVNGLRGDEASKIEKYEEIDANGKPISNYYVVSIYNLIPDRDYGFLILETSYTDPEGRELIERQDLSKVVIDENPVTNETYDNTTEKTALTGLAAFNVTIIEDNQFMKIEPRKVEIPVFVDDIHGKLLRVELEQSEETLDIEFKYENDKILFSGLKPETDAVYKVNFIYDGDNGSEKTLAKYAKIKTPKVQAVDVKSAIINASGTEANVKFEYYTDPKSPIETVRVKNISGVEIKSKWDSKTNSLKLEGLEKNTEYRNLEVSFTLQNAQVATYTLDNFKTGASDEVKPSGDIANFVARVYEIALGREPEVEGWNFWISKLEKKEISATEFIAENLMTQPEFVEKKLNKTEFIKTMYKLIVNREPDLEGQSYWEAKYYEYNVQNISIENLRIKIAREMMNEPEFKKLVGSIGLRY